MSLLLNLLFEADSYSNEYLLAKFGVDTAENGPLKVSQKLANSWKKVRKNIGLHEPRRAEALGIGSRQDRMQEARDARQLAGRGLPAAGDALPDPR